VANFYLREDLADVHVGGETELDGAEARHIVAVSRTRVGETLLVGNGRGLVTTGTVTMADPARVVLTVTAMHTEPPASPRLVLVQALAKGDRDELAVQTAVELGVDEIVPWQAARSVSVWRADRVRKGVERWRSIVREAAKQSMRPWLPAVGEPVSTAELVGRAARSRMVVLEPNADAPLSGLVVDTDDARDLVVVVGPEGGVAPEESTALRAAGAGAVRLGSTVLRTSSAGPAAIAVLNLALGRW
jgi:16S rRNA (uracil1498-N3)-methyltransferase